MGAIGGKSPSRLGIRLIKKPPASLDSHLKDAGM